MSEAEKSPWQVGLMTLAVSFIGAGSGAAAWLTFIVKEPISVSTPLQQDDFHSPSVNVFTLRRKATLTFHATASSVVYNPEAGSKQYPYSGLHLESYVDGTKCSEQEMIVKEQIHDGGFPLSLDIACGPMDLAAGQHVLTVKPLFIGSCKSIETSPNTCNTNRIRGGYALVE